MMKINTKWTGKPVTILVFITWFDSITITKIRNICIQKKKDVNLMAEWAVGWKRLFRHLRVIIISSIIHFIFPHNWFYDIHLLHMGYMCMRISCMHFHDRVKGALKLFSFAYKLFAKVNGTAHTKFEWQKYLL